MNKDAIAKETWNQLFADFSWRNKGVRLFAADAVEHPAVGFKHFRDFKFPELDDSLDVTTYRYCKQLGSFFDRFIADSDEVQTKLLKKEAVFNFVQGQANVLTALPGSTRAHLVLREIRRIVGLILGPCPDLAMLDDWRVPEKASEGVQRSEGYLHEKLKNLSATADQHDLCERLLTGCAFKRSYVDVNSVSPLAVDKKWNKNRIIAPDTVASGIVSNAIGRFVEQRLRDSVGIDIKIQQHVHRRLVRECSKTGALATMDLSAASDSISIPLLRRILPSRWYRLLSKCRTRLYRIGEGPSSVLGSLQSFMTMGVGYTFPLQTVVFYAIIQATKNLLRASDPYGYAGKITVYGDDCIFPTTLYPFVTRVFVDLGFKVNEDKSFHTGFFRESCGEDCFKGHSVRPAFFKWDDGCTTENVYQLINTLLRRYHILEIPRTFKYLVSLIMYYDGIVLRVPPSYPERAGIRVETPECFAAESLQPEYGVHYSPIYFDYDRTVSVPAQRGQLGNYKFLALTQRKQRAKIVDSNVGIYNHLVETLHKQHDDKYFHHGVLMPIRDKFSLNGYNIGIRFVAVSRSEEALQSKWAMISYRKKKRSSAVVAPGLEQGGVEKKLRLLVPSKVKPDPQLVRSGCETPWWT